MDNVKKYRYLQILIHVVFAILFILTPYLTSIAQNIGPGVDKFNQHKVDLESIFVQKGYLRWVIQNCILVVFFYLVYLIVAPLLLERKRNYVLYAIVCFLLSLIFIWFVYIMHSIIDAHIGHDTMRFVNRFINSFIYCFALAGLATALYLVFGFHELTRKQKLIEQKQAETELLFLRSQINPHFLFNSLNNIYSLSIQNSKMTPDAILKLSELLRFALYESSELFISLHKELNYIDNYIALQAIRLSSNVEIKYEVNVGNKSYKIHPMLLMPFIENAFKHGISYSEPCKMEIAIAQEKNVIELRVENAIFIKQNSELNKEYGIGIKNVTRRLEILYPGKYSLNKRLHDKRYSVELKLYLDEK